MPSTYDKIETYTTSGSATSYTFTSIPQTYTDLLLVMNLSRASVDDTMFRVGNGSVDSGSNYSATWLEGNGSSASSGRWSNQTAGIIDYGTSNITNLVHFMNYSNTTTNKTMLVRENDAATLTGARVNLWRSTAAINRIQVYNFTGIAFSNGSTFTLYGIKAA